MLATRDTPGMKALIVDSLAAVAFFTLIAATMEVFVAQMTWEQVLAVRLAAIPVILFTGRPYGVWRDMILRLGNANAPPRCRRAGLDVLAFLSFQVPVFIAILTFAGATPEQMMRAVPTATLLMLLISRIYGLYLDHCRRLVGLAPAPVHVTR